jgi:hypothetical protein
MSKTREDPVPDSDTPEQPTKLPMPPSSPLPPNNALDTTALKVKVTLHLQVLGSLKKMALSCLQLSSRQKHLTLTP